jgi:hypothetical protein
MWDPQLFWAECYSKIIERMIYKINFSLRGYAIESELSFTTAGALSVVLVGFSPPPPLPV